MSSNNIYTPYTYLIGWSALNKFYYGRRTAKNCHPSDLWTKYYTSSKVVKQYRKDFGEPDIIQIRQTFTDPKKCIDWECKVLERLHVEHNDKFLNQKSGDRKWDTTGIRISRRHSEETKAKISKAKKGENCTKETRQKISIAVSNRIVTEETRKKMSELRKGKSPSEEHRKNLSIANKGKCMGVNSSMYGKKRPDTTQWNLETKAKKYLVSYQDGEWFEITNLSKFCREHNLKIWSLRKTIRYPENSHEGWRARNLDQ